jgi:hypothetical protein
LIKKAKKKNKKVEKSLTYVEDVLTGKKKKDKKKVKDIKLEQDQHPEVAHA